MQPRADLFDNLPGDRQLTLKFNVDDEANVSSYQIMRDGAMVGEITNVNQGSYTFVDNNLVNSRRYEYSIVAVELDGPVTLDFDGETVWSGVPSFRNGTVTEYALYQNYPNPFNPSTEIVYDVLEATHVTLKVFNVMGQEVATLADGPHAAGRYPVTFDATGMTSGVYFFTVTMVDKFSATKKMLLIQ